MVEYVLIVAIITVGIAAFFAPRIPKPDDPDKDKNKVALNFYNILRDTYRRAVVFVSVPLL